jgi:hypothetical protein
MEDLHKKLVLSKKIPLSLYRNARHQYCDCERSEVESQVRQSSTVGGFVFYLKISPSKDTRLCRADKVMVLTVPTSSSLKSPEATPQDQEMKIESSREVVSIPSPSLQLESKISSETTVIEFEHKDTAEAHIRWKGVNGQSNPLFVDDEN